jgi:ATP-dependent RNA helicase MRH4
MRSVEIEYRNPDLQSPVYLAGSFTDPPWRLLRMELKTNSEGEQVFSAPVWVNPDREYQFKFKLGDWDVWRVDENRPVGE